MYFSYLVLILSLRSRLDVPLSDRPLDHYLENPEFAQQFINFQNAQAYDRHPLIPLMGFMFSVYDGISSVIWTVRTKIVNFYRYFAPQ